MARCGSNRTLSMTKSNSRGALLCPPCTRGWAITLPTIGPWVRRLRSTPISCNNISNLNSLPCRLCIHCTTHCTTRFYPTAWCSPRLWVPNLVRLLRRLIAATRIPIWQSLATPWIPFSIGCPTTTRYLVFSPFLSSSFICYRPLSEQHCVAICRHITMLQGRSQSASQLNLYQIHLFWRHHPMKIFFLMCGNRCMSILRCITNASPLPNSCFLTSPPDENFLLNVWYSVLISTVYVTRPLTNVSQLNLYQIRLFWRHHPVKFFFSMFGNRFIHPSYVAAHKFIPKYNLYQINLFWRHHPMKIFFLMCDNRYISMLRPLTNASQLNLYHNSCVLTSPPDENFLLNAGGTRYISICYLAAHKCIAIESLPNSFVLTSPLN